MKDPPPRAMGLRDRETRPRRPCPSIAVEMATRFGLEQLGDAARQALAWAVAAGAAAPVPQQISKVASSAEPSPGEVPVKVATLTYGLHRAPNDQAGPSDLVTILAYLGIPATEQGARFVDADGVAIGATSPAELVDLPPLDGEVEAILETAASFAASERIDTRHLLAGLARLRPAGPLDAILADLGDDAGRVYDLLLRRGSEITVAPIEADLDAGLQGLRGALGAGPPSTGTQQGIVAVGTSDEPTHTDLLGFAPLANSIVALLRHPDTHYPLTLAVTGRWGGGKSSILRLVEDRLWSKTKDGLSGPPWTIVKFPAWRYAPGEELWAALAKAIYDAALAERSWPAQQRFKIGLEIRRTNWTLVLIKGGLATIGGLIGAGLGALASPALTGTSGSAAPIIGGLGGIGGVVAVLRALWGNVADPFKRTIESLTDDSGKDLGGPDAKAIHNIEELLGIILDDHAERSRDEPIKSGLAITIDDLDRCNPRSVVHLVEAINQIFVGEALKTKDRRIAFIIAMDREVVAASVEAEYKTIVESLGSQATTTIGGYGLEFLDKIVQLWVAVPHPTSESLKALARQIGSPTPRIANTPDSRLVGDFKTQIIDASLARGGSLADLATAAAEFEHAQPDDPVVRAAARLARIEAYSSRFAAMSLLDSPEIESALEAGIECLDRNPRQVKRYVNAFRLQLHVAWSNNDVTFRPDQLQSLARWVAVRLRWPGLAQLLDDDPDLLVALEHEANPKRMLTAADRLRVDAAKGRHEDMFGPAGRAELAELLPLLKVSRRSQFMQALPFEAFLRVS